MNAVHVRSRGRTGALLAVLTLAACGGADREAAPRGDTAAEFAAAGAPAVSGAPVLGPVDGRDLPGTDLGRIALGDAAPDFTLATYRGDTLTLSENWGTQEILLVFYRGAW